jgi:transcriptional regulator with GAF, ATPase, and Fis domain
MRDACIHEIRPAIFNQADFTALVTGNVLKKHYADTFQVRSSMVLPLLIDHKRPFILSFYSKSEQVFEPSMLQFLGRIQQSLISTISTILSAPFTQDPGLTEKTARLFNEMPDQSSSLPGIIGKSRQLLAVLDYARQVAVADTSVLLLGETGTGKEKIANYIHNLSPRSNQQMVKVNCAALPGTLIESELFGHEKGAFTGAISKRIGRFEQAKGGTLFLDEIGDVPMDIQVKLLRVLQEKEFERIGGNETIKANVRIIAATNKNLEKEIAEGRFRMDLYYRLNVFPITLPPLRRRKEDIPSLVNYFINIYAKKHQKKAISASGAAMEQLMRYDWLGNIRELENSIERSVVLTRGEQIEQAFIQSAQNQLPFVAGSAIKTIEEVEKEHILSVLVKCNQKIYGPGGAAEMLNLPPSTLTSKIKKLRIGKD